MTKLTWKHLAAHSDGELKRAIQFYQTHPDGQWDWLAALAIQAVLHQRLLDSRAGIRWRRPKGR